MPSPTQNNPSLHLLHEPAYSDDQTASSSSSSPPPGRDRDRDHRRHEDVHGSDAPPVQAALCGGVARRRAQDDRHAAAAAGSSNSGTAIAVEGISGRETRHSSGTRTDSGSGTDTGTSSGAGSGSGAASPRPAPTRASPCSAPGTLPKRGGLNPVFNTDRSDRSGRGLGDIGLVVPGLATVTRSSRRVPSFGVDMSALSGGGGGEKAAVGKAEGAGDEGGWAPTPSPLIFGSHSMDGKGNHGSCAAGARAGRGGGGGGSGVGRRGGHASSLLGTATPVSPSKGPLSFSGAATRQGGEQPSHVWPLPKPAAAAAAVPAGSEAVQEHVYDSDDDDAAMPPEMVPLHRVARGNTTSTSNISADSADSAGGKAASGVAGGAKKSTPQKQKLGGKAEYAMLFSGGNE